MGTINVDQHIEQLANKIVDATGTRQSHYSQNNRVSRVAVKNVSSRNEERESNVRESTVRKEKQSLLDGGDGTERASTETTQRTDGVVTVDPGDPAHQGLFQRGDLVFGGKTGGDFGGETGGVFGGEAGAFGDKAVVQIPNSSNNNNEGTSLDASAYPAQTPTQTQTHTEAQTQPSNSFASLKKQVTTTNSSPPQSDSDHNNIPRPRANSKTSIASEQKCYVPRRVSSPQVGAVRGIRVGRSSFSGHDAVSVASDSPLPNTVVLVDH